MRDALHCSEVGCAKLLARVAKIRRQLAFSIQNAHCEERVSNQAVLLKKQKRPPSLSLTSLRFKTTTPKHLVSCSNGTESNGFSISVGQI